MRELRERVSAIFDILHPNPDAEADRKLEREAKRLRKLHGLT